MSFIDSEREKYEKFYEDHYVGNIKGCPFCGQYLAHIVQGKGSNGDYYYMFCENCHAKSGTSRRVEVAFNNWQKRA